MEKKLVQTVEEVRRQHPDAEVEVWAEDEHRVGLHRVNRRVWTPADEPPYRSGQLQIPVDVVSRLCLPN